MAVPASRSLRPPVADRVEVFERKAQRIHDAVAGIARRLGAVQLHDLADRLGFLAFLVLLESLDIGGGAAGGVPRMFSRINAPRMTGAVRLA